MRRILAGWWIVFVVSLMAAVVIPVAANIVDLKITRAVRDFRALDTGLELFRRERGRYPTEAEGLAALVSDVFVRVPIDPWGNAYVYRQMTGSPYVVYSIGIDKRDERGAGDDVTTWSKEYRCADYGVNCPPDGRHLATYAALLLAVSSFIVGLVRGVTALYHWQVKRRGASA